jgi:hypothetical protein
MRLPFGRWARWKPAARNVRAKPSKPSLRRPEMLSGPGRSIRACRGEAYGRTETSVVSTALSQSARVQPVYGDRA